MSEIIFCHTYRGADGGERGCGWMRCDQNDALKEGWFLDENDGAIQGDETRGRFSRRSDPNRAAFDHVRARATAGSVLHLKAMMFDARAALGAWQDRLDESLDRADAA